MVSVILPSKSEIAPQGRTELPKGHFRNNTCSEMDSFGSLGIVLFHNCSTTVKDTSTLLSLSFSSWFRYPKSVLKSTKLNSCYSSTGSLLRSWVVRSCPGNENLIQVFFLLNLHSFWACVILSPLLCWRKAHRPLQPLHLRSRDCARAPALLTYQTLVSGVPKAWTNHLYDGYHEKVW